MLRLPEIDWTGPLSERGRPPRSDAAQGRRYAGAVRAEQQARDAAALLALSQLHLTITPMSHVFTKVVRRELDWRHGTAAPQFAIRHLRASQPSNGPYFRRSAAAASGAANRSSLPRLPHVGSDPPCRVRPPAV